MKPANYAAIYCCLYPQLAEIAREHGYAMAVHGSMARDFDLICIPWVAEPKEPQAVVDAITSKFAINQVGGMEVKDHGRETYTVNVKFGECFLDLSFMPRLSAHPVSDDQQAKDAALLRDLKWRIDDIRDDLMGGGRGHSVYGIDEWSVPAQNLKKASNIIDAAIATTKQDG